MQKSLDFSLGYRSVRNNRQYYFMGLCGEAGLSFRPAGRNLAIEQVKVKQVKVSRVSGDIMVETRQNTHPKSRISGDIMVETRQYTHPKSRISSDIMVEKIPDKQTI